MIFQHDREVRINLGKWDLFSNLYEKKIPVDYGEECK
jgi:hypothetical protein